MHCYQLVELHLAEMLGSFSCACIVKDGHSNFRNIRGKHAPRATCFCVLTNTCLCGSHIYVTPFLKILATGLSTVKNRHFSYLGHLLAHWYLSVNLLNMDNPVPDASRATKVTERACNSHNLQLQNINAATGYTIFKYPIMCKITHLCKISWASCFAMS